MGVTSGEGNGYPSGVHLQFSVGIVLLNITFCV